MQSKVYLAEVKTYDEDVIYEKLRWMTEAMGGLEKVLQVSKDARVLLKPNLVRKAEVDRAVMTHPAVMGAVARLVSEAGYTNIYAGDSCGYGTAAKVMDGTGMDENLKKYGVKICDFDSGTKVDIGGHRAKQMVLSDEVIETDALINVCKMKTHALERVTGAVKNLYGTVYALNKAKGHTQYPYAYSFAGMLVDLNHFIGPKLHIMDGIVAMEGNGPTSGDPVQMNVLLASTDPVALYTVFCHLIDLKPELVPTNVIGTQQKLGTSNEGDITIVMPEGESSFEEAVKRFGKADFNVDRTIKRQYANWIRMLKIFKLFQKKPYIDAKECIHCGICVDSCPVEGKALQFKNGRKEPPVYDYKKCIRCFCCQEMCPHKAIKVKR